MQRCPPRGGAAIIGLGCDPVWLVRRGAGLTTADLRARQPRLG